MNTKHPNNLWKKIIENQKIQMITFKKEILEVVNINQYNKE